MEHLEAWTPTRREVFGAAAGAALALTGIGHRATLSRRPAAGPVALWAADRAGHAVYGLDADGLVVLRCPVVAPVDVIAEVGGTCVVVSAPEGRSAGIRTCCRVTGDETLPAPLFAAAPRMTPSQAWGSIVGQNALPIVGATQPTSEAGTTSVWILRSAERDGCRLERWVLPRTRHRAPSEASRWVRAFLLTFPWSARALAGTRSGVWLVGARVPEVRFVTSTGRVVISRRLDDLDGSDAAIAAHRESGGGVWIAACGALARLDRTGRRLPGQGGFAHLVALASARAGRC